MSDYILSIDQGTTGSRVFIFNKQGEPVASAYKEFTQHFPKPGWVEHDAEEIWAGVRELITAALKKAGIEGSQVAGIGITNQRETVVIWDRETGKPIHNAIVWQCRRTAGICKALKEKGYEKTVRKKTGLVIDAYFSGTKIQWLLDEVSGAREKAVQGKLAAGTIDTWLLYKLTGEHKTEYTNASRTMLYNIETKEWDHDLLRLLDVPSEVLPEVLPSRSEFGKTKGIGVLPDGIPVNAMLGDQQAALFGQLCVRPGEAKNTYGTGCFLLFNTGDQFLISKQGLITTLACDKDGNVAYCLEGAVFIAGAVVQWLRDYVQFFTEAPQSEELIANIKDEEDDIVFVPAFSGLGAPHWDMNARGAIFGLTRDTDPARITRAALKSIAFQSRDLVVAMEKDTGKKMSELRVDGGATANNYLMQFQSDILNSDVIRPANVDTTALGSAYLAGIQAGIWKDADELAKLAKNDTTFSPKMGQDRRNREVHYWNKGVNRVKDWLE